MQLEARKINLIREVLNIDNNTLLDQLEDVLKGHRPEVPSKLNIYDIAGRLTKEEAKEFERVILEVTETVHPDDWK